MRGGYSLVATAVIGVSVLGACSNSSSDGPSSGNECKTIVSSIAANPISGYINMTGSFYTDETMQVTWFDGPNRSGTAHSFTATPSSNRLQLTVGPYDAGTHDFYVSVSCTRSGGTGSDLHGPFSVTVN